MSVGLYRGSPKHKNRPASGPKGTLCPEWTHATPDGGLAHDVHAHDWNATDAAVLFDLAQVDIATGRRFATARGLAFEARPTNDGSWHGFPVPWQQVPSDVKDRMVDAKLVSPRQIRSFLSFDRTDLHWALETDDRS